jgi:hypothetical protein
MSTDQIPEGNEPGPLLGLGLSEGLGALDLVAVVRHLPGDPKPWLGKRIVSLIATVPWHLQPSGRRARKAKFAAWARSKRRWTAEYKRITLAAGKHYEATPQQVRAWLRRADCAPNARS